MLSTVAAAPWADWSVAPLFSHTNNNPSNTGSGLEGERQKIWTTISIEKSLDEHGVSLWVYLVLPSTPGEGEEGEKKVALREICWVYGDEDPASWELEVAAMAARPHKGASSGNLEVEVRDMVVRWA
jgi:uncharacterized protein